VGWALAVAPLRGQGATTLRRSKRGFGFPRRTLSRVKLPHLPHGRQQPGMRSGHETAVVRKYRFLLRTTPPQDLVAAHADALGRVSGAVRQSLLGTVRGQLLVGQRVDVDDIDQFARLLTWGETRSPGALLNAYDAAAVEQLAAAIIGSESVRGLLARYPEWDGVDPAPVPEPLDSAQFKPGSRWSLDREPPSMSGGISAGGGPS
jgi:hypothetical protein